MSEAKGKAELGAPVIEARDVSKTYEEGRVEALKKVAFEVRRGEYCLIMGPSGSGKSTLLHLIGALDLPTEGRIEILGQDTTSSPSLPRLRRENLGFVFQLHNLIPNLSLRENVELPALPTSLPRAERKRRATALLERVGLGHRIDFPPVKASGGERQRAAIARALINEPEILLADEPTGSVDSKTGDAILGLFDELRQERGLTVVMITHNPVFAEKADRVLKIVDGVLSEGA